MNLDTTMWGTYHRSRKRTPLCTAAHCYKYAVYRFTEKIKTEFYCERHAGEFGGTFIDAVWDIIEQHMDDAWQAEQERRYREGEA